MKTKSVEILRSSRNRRNPDLYFKIQEHKKAFEPFKYIGSHKLKNVFYGEYIEEDGVHCLESKAFNVVACGSSQEEAKSNFEDEFLSVRESFLATPDQEFNKQALDLKKKFRGCF